MCCKCDSLSQRVAAMVDEKLSDKTNSQNKVNQKIQEILSNLFNRNWDEKDYLVSLDIEIVVSKHSHGAIKLQENFAISGDRLKK